MFEKPSNFWEFHLDWRGFYVSTAWDGIIVYNMGFITYVQYEDVI